MAERPIWYFAPFHVDLEDERLWRDTAAVRLTAKAFAVLRHLVEHAGQLVTREELFAAVWGTTYVSDAALAVCIRELRQALGDTAQTPQYVETVRGRERAAELAGHFVQGRDAPRAVHYLQYTGAQAMQRCAYQEAVTCFEHALTIAPQLPVCRDTQALTIDLYLALRTACCHWANTSVSWRPYARLNHSPRRWETSSDSPGWCAIWRHACGCWATRSTLFRWGSVP